MLNKMVVLPIGATTMAETLPWIWELFSANH